MLTEIEHALAPLVGLPVGSPGRASNMLSLALGPYALHVFCAWRLSRGAELLAASGDLFTPADPDADLETFDYDEPGATWWDERLTEYLARPDAPATVAAATADVLGGVRLTLSDGAVLELFPNSSPAPHYETEFWRLLRPGSPDPPLSVGTWGVAHVEDERP